MAPPGTRTLVQYKIQNRGAWSPYGHEGWHISPAMLHYRCLTLDIPKVDKERVSVTTEFFPSTLTMPIISSKDAAIHATADLTCDLLNPTPANPLTTLGYKQKASLGQFTEIFNKAVSPQVTPPPMVNTLESTPVTAPAPN